MGDEITDVPKRVLRHVVAIRLSRSERTHVERLASEAGLPPATFIRQAALSAVVLARAEIPAVNRETYLELARVDESVVRRLAAVAKSLALQVLSERPQ